MKAKEIIATALGAMKIEATRTVDPHIGNIEASMVKIIDLLDSLPDSLNLELNVILQADGENPE